MDWYEFDSLERQKEYFPELQAAVDSEYGRYLCYPLRENIYNAFKLTPVSSIRCVILGQDPYHGPGQATGLAFSVPHSFPLPPSLRNIYKEIEADTGSKTVNPDGCLEPWASQGVLLLNSSLSVRVHEPGSHADLGWGTYTDNFIKMLGALDQDIVYMLWGKFARSKKQLITNKRQLILEAPHPSPFSANRGFFGCRHFSKCNEYLESKGQNKIIW